MRMPVLKTPILVAEIHCLSCSRILADVVRDPGQRRVRLQPTHAQPGVQVVVAGKHLLRCRRCNGRAFVEPVEVPTPVRAAAPEREFAAVA
jgi:hypothetical protein